jgi:hypothetical protein
MPLSTTTIFTCDRDGVTAEVTSSEQTTHPPDDWGRMFYDRGTEHVEAHLCPACADALKVFMSNQ